MLTKAHTRGWIKDKPSVPRSKPKEGRIRFLTPEEEQELLQWTHHFGFESYVRLWIVAVDTGARMGELRKLQARDIDLQRRRVSFWDTKAGDSRSVPLTRRAAAALSKEIEENGSKGSVLVFKTVTRRAVNAVWDMARDKMKLIEDAQFVPHSLRHTCASRLVQRGVDLRRVQKFMGHKAIQTTLRYAHLAPDDLMSAMEALEDSTGHLSVVDSESPAAGVAEW